MSDVQRQQSQNTNGAPTSTRASSRKNRVYVFREFILEQYGDFLKKGDVILDGAGGKGDLSWLLKNADGFESVIVDPRLSQSNHMMRSLSYLRSNPSVAQERCIPGLPTYQPLAALLPQLPSEDAVEKPLHLRLLVDKHLVKAVEAYKKNQSMESWIEYWEDATKRATFVNTLGYEEEASEDRIEKQICVASEALSLILRTRLVAGFHPDQATEALMDLATVLNVPFAIVPCCVFPSEFPDRKQSDGSRVKSYSQLMVYLKAKFLHTAEGELDFFFTETAKNRVLYSPLKR